MDYRGKLAIVTGASSGIGRETARAFAAKVCPPREPVYAASKAAMNSFTEGIEKRRHEITVPKRNLALTTARILRAIAPSLLRKGMARMEPVPPEIVERARARALEKSIDGC